MVCQCVRGFKTYGRQQVAESREEMEGCRKQEDSSGGGRKGDGEFGMV